MKVYTERTEIFGRVWGSYRYPYRTLGMFLRIPRFSVGYGGLYRAYRNFRYGMEACTERTETLGRVCTGGNTGGIPWYICTRTVIFSLLNKVNGRKCFLSLFSMSICVNIKRGRCKITQTPSIAASLFLPCLSSAAIPSVLAALLSFRRKAAFVLGYNRHNNTTPLRRRPPCNHTLDTNPVT